MSRDPAETSAKDRVREHVKAGTAIPPHVMNQAEAEHRQETGHAIVPTGKELIAAIMAEKGEAVPAAPGLKVEGGHGAPVGPVGTAHMTRAFGTQRPGDVPLEEAGPAATTLARQEAAARKAKPEKAVAKATKKK